MVRVREEQVEPLFANLAQASKFIEAPRTSTSKKSNPPNLFPESSAQASAPLPDSSMDVTKAPESSES